MPGGIPPTASYLLVRDLPHTGCHHTEGPGGIFLPHFCAVEPAYSAVHVPRQALSVPGEELPSRLVLNLLLYTEADLWSSSIYGLIGKKLFFFTQGQGRKSLDNLSGIIQRISTQAES